MKSILITSSILIVLLAALRPLLRGKIDPRVQYALWLAAALRLLVPVNFVTSAYSAMSLVNRAEAPVQVAQAIGQTTVPILAMSPESAVIQASQEYGAHDGVIRLEPSKQVQDRAEELMRGPTLAELAAKYARPVWLGGAAVMGLWFLLVNLRLRRKLRAALPVEADCPLPVYVTPELPSSCLCGVFRPAVYVTPAALADPGRMRHVLAHELTHYRHRDHWWAWVRCLCLCLYWFDPLVWWAAALSRQDCELACDEGAIRRLGEPERIPYGRTLVAMIAAGRNPLLQTATTMTGGRRRVQERIKLIARRPKTVAAAALALALIVGCAVGCTFTGAPEDASGPAPFTQPDPAPLDAPRFPLSTLRERLLDVPEELRPTVTASASGTKAGINDIALATYWWDVPAEWEDERSPWLLDVHRWERTGIDARGWPDTSDDCIRDLIAQDEKFYYVMERPVDTRFQMEDSESFTAAYQAIRAFAEKTVLETQDVERYPGQPLDTLQERLETIPAGLRGTVVFLPREQAEDADSLVSYWMDRDWAEPDGTGMGWLLNVERWDQVRFEDYLYSIATGNYEVFARDSGHYYAFMRATDVRYEMADAEYYAAAFRDIRRYAEQQVLGTKGVEPFDAEELRSRDSLWEGKTYTDVAYWPYKNVNGNTDIVWILRLVQLAKDGEGGVWIPEGWQVIDGEHGVDPTPRHIRPSEAQGMTITEYAAQLQAEADAGNADWALDPIQVCMRFAETDFGHSSANVTEDCFTRDYAYIQSALEGTLPAPEQLLVQETVDVLVGSDHMRMWLVIDSQGSGRQYGIYDIDPGQDPYAGWLESLPTRFTWEEFDWGTTEEPRFPLPPQDSASLWLDNLPASSGDPYPDNFARLRLWDTGLAYVHDDVNGTHWYYARGAYSYDEGLIPYGYLRSWYDALEIGAMRPDPIPDEGRSHEEIARAWAEGWEGVMTKASPGSTFACSYVRIDNVKADCHSFMSEEDMDEFARSRDRVGADYGKTWFGFTYETVFVPDGESARESLWAGNTWYYEGDDAPEGALIYSRVAYMDLTDEGWVCRGTGTGW